MSSQHLSSQHLSSQHLSWRHLSISGKSQLLLTRLWQNFKGKAADPKFLAAMSSSRSDIVQSTFVLATFVHIGNILAVTDSILTKDFGPIFILVQIIILIEIFLGQILFTKIFWTQNILNKQIFRPKFLDPNFCLT